MSLFRAKWRILQRSDYWNLGGLGNEEHDEELHALAASMHGRLRIFVGRRRYLMLLPLKTPQMEVASCQKALTASNDAREGRTLRRF